MLGETVGTTSSSMNVQMKTGMSEILILKVAIQEAKWAWTKTVWVWY